MRLDESPLGVELLVSHLSAALELDTSRQEEGVEGLVGVSQQRVVIGVSLLAGAGLS